LQIKTKILSSHAPNSKPVKQEGNCRVILPPLVFPGMALGITAFNDTKLSNNQHFDNYRHNILHNDTKRYDM
jgi:hypothetical protein